MPLPMQTSPQVARGRGFASSLFLTYLALVAVTANAPGGTTIYVATCGDDSWTGATPDCAAPDGPKRHIQNALDAASDGDEIIVADGTYKGTIDFKGKAVYLHSANGRDVTAIDSAGGKSVVTCANGEGPDTILEGFTITGGRGTPKNDGSSYYGGGMYNYGASPTVRNCAFANNGGTYEGDLSTLWCYGAGMYNYNSSVVIENCIFSENTLIGRRLVPAGGAICNESTAASIIDCEFLDNRVAYDQSGVGGAIYNDNCNVTIRRCSFTGNSCDGGGGAVFSSDSRLDIHDCSFYGNKALSEYGSGGALSDWDSDVTVELCAFTANCSTVGGGIDHVRGSLTLTKAIFRQNSASGEFQGYGGGAYISAPGSIVASCTFRDNSAERQPGDPAGPGGLYINGGTVIDCIFVANRVSSIGAGGGLWCRDSSVIGCAIIANHAHDAGGMRCAGNSLIANCTFVANDCSPKDRRGAGLLADGTVVVANCTFTSNTGGGGVENLADSLTITNSILRGDTDVEIGGDPAEVSFSNVQGGYTGDRNIDADPLFMQNPDPGPDKKWGTDDDDYGDLRLQTDSPCIDAGDPNYAAAPGETDLDHHFRIWDGNADGVAIIDMGAYEFGAFAYGDLNCDGAVDFDDIDAFVAALTDRTGYEQTYPACNYLLADTNADGAVDFTDIDGFVDCLINHGCQ